jgi:SHS family lactate transporter-like MFS transporter
VAGDDAIAEAIRRRERMGMGLSDEDLEDAAEVRREREAARQREKATTQHL